MARSLLLQWLCAGLALALLAGCVHPPALTPVTTRTTWSALQALPVPPADRVVSYGATPLQSIDVRQPRTPGRHPVVILLHGGCWLNSFDSAYLGHLAEALRGQGWATFNVEYRRLGDAGGGWPGSLDDVATATKFILAHAAEWQLDTRQVVVAGHSAGGHLALLLAGRDPRVTAVVGLAAITDLAAYQKETNSCSEGARQLVPAAGLAAADPMQQPLPRARIFLWSGSADPIVPARYGTRYAARSGAINHTLWPGAGHFDLVSPQSVVWPEILRQFSHLR
jgi:acetyl esterase/lipase